MKANTILESLIKKYGPHTKHWDCYNDSPLEKNHTKDCILIHCDNMLKELRNIQKQLNDVPLVDLEDKLKPQIQLWTKVKQLAKNYVKETN